MLIEYVLSVLVDLDLGDHFHSGGFEPEVESAQSRKC